MTNEPVKPKRRTSPRKAKNASAQANPPEAVPIKATSKAKTKPPEGDVTTRLSGQLDLLADVAGKTTHIVQQAVSVLEEELSAGIGGAKNLEQKYVDVTKLRSADSQEVIQRFRKDAHDVVDILIDLVNVTTNALNGLSQRAINIGVSQTPAKESSQGSRQGAIPSLAVGTPVKPGQAVEIPMTLENDSDKPTDAFFFLSSDLVNMEGERISSKQVSFTPEKLVIEPKKSATVTITVQVPESTSPGTYSGLLQATRLEQVRAVLSILIT